MKNHFRMFWWLSLLLLISFIHPKVSNAFDSPRRNISLETKWGYYIMDSSKWEDRIYSRKYAILGGIKTNLELLRQVLQLGIGVGYMREHEPRYYIYNIPLEATLNIRLKFSPNQFIVPYFGGGGDYSYFKEKGRDLISGVQTTVIRHNNRKGYHLNIGLQFLLNQLAKTEAGLFDQKFGVNATYLALEARYADLTNFDTLKANETDVSGWIFSMGLLFEF